VQRGIDDDPVLLGAVGNIVDDKNLARITVGFCITESVK
jgi:hypothetical protein